MTTYTIRNDDTLKGLKKVSEKTGIKSLLDVINFLIKYWGDRNK